MDWFSNLFIFQSSVLMKGAWLCALLLAQLVNLVFISALGCFIYVLAHLVNLVFISALGCFISVLA
jgi:hypothetical protein